MGRWGGEETKTQGLVGCTIAGLILLASAWAGYAAYPAVADRAALEKEANKIVRASRKLKETEIVDLIYKASDKYVLDIERSQIKVTRRMQDKYTPVVELNIKIQATVDFGLFESQIPLPPIYCEVTHISF